MLLRVYNQSASHNQEVDGEEEEEDAVFLQAHMGAPCSVRFSTADQANQTRESDSLFVRLTPTRKPRHVMVFSSHLSIPHQSARPFPLKTSAPPFPPNYC